MPARVTLNVVVLLAFMQLLNDENDDRPKGSQNTWLERYLWLSLLFVTLAMLEFGLQDVLQRMRKRASGAVSAAMHHKSGGRHVHAAGSERHRAPPHSKEEHETTSAATGDADHGEQHAGAEVSVSIDELSMSTRQRIARFTRTKSFKTQLFATERGKQLAASPDWVCQWAFPAAYIIATIVHYHRRGPNLGQ